MTHSFLPYQTKSNFICEYCKKQAKDPSKYLHEVCIPKYPNSVNFDAILRRK